MRSQIAKMLGLAAVLALPLTARAPLSERIGRTDPSRYQTTKAVHEGAGQISYLSLLDERALDVNLRFLHRGVLDPGSGIGHHFHHSCEEMLVLLSGEAEFTVDGRTSRLKAPVAVPSRMGRSHAIYNSSDKPAEWMNMNVTAVKGVCDAFNLGDPRVGVPLDPIPVFVNSRLDRALLRPVRAMGGGRGTVQYRRAFGPGVFLGPWSYVDHLVIPPGASVGPESHPETGEFYYVMSGQGSVTVSAQGSGPETAAVRAGDAVPINTAEQHTFENTGEEPLEFLIIGISRGDR